MLLEQLPKNNVQRQQQYFLVWYTHHGKGISHVNEAMVNFNVSFFDESPVIRTTPITCSKRVTVKVSCVTAPIGKAASQAEDKGEISFFCLFQGLFW